ncbi:MAG: indolepyruvate ferredoxin oxidoreductase subunit alpha [Planctomycetaceae bacterium]|jgi:indolepyruvate ferredoxin oxidoreductase alpha subunit|nr:indolepyruvate ferredoxin oxidoreductase subunit alpha [Planctomycetaceae bacterium]
MTKQLLSGNEAFARGAWEAGVAFAAGYPGTPSTEILENVAAHYKDDIYCEWSPNEKVAFEAAAGASFTGVRTLTTMKHVGLNVAADPLMTLAYIGAVGGFVAIVADDPGMHSSQNEQDTRQYARFAKIPIFDPSDSNDAKEFVKLAYEVSEQFNTPVIVRSTTRVSHSRGLVTTNDRVPAKKADFVKEPPRFVPIPMWARQMRVRVEERLGKLQAAASQSPVNTIEWADKKFGVITCGVSYQYVRETFPNVSVLKLGWVYPFPEALIRKFAAEIENVLVIEEGDDFIEGYVKSLGIVCRGKPLFSLYGELSPDALVTAIANDIENNTANKQSVSLSSLTVQTTPKKQPLKTALPQLPARPPVLCPGCPHRGVFHALGRFDVVVTGDIGCYSLGVMPPLSRMDTILCMGGGISLAHGIDKVNNTKKVVGMVGDSTFFHSGMTGLLDIAYNKGGSTIIVVDNRITAMTGHQDNPGSGKTLMGDTTNEASIEEIGKACGIKNIRTIEPRDIKNAVATLKEAIDSNEAWLIVSKAPCPLHLRKPLGPPLKVDEAICKKCNACLKLGCPGLEKAGNQITINQYLCAGCEMCKNVCPAKAIT